ncbi:probable TIM21 Constituent of the mitochondrial inner membrane presequence translocase (TIM23 complex) [Rhynchosporium secalis]|uniref:Mitochondrial import inner membrane translocase subunit Tim21 n=1 Tax=Rhynchosporium secalis TaxID=38038 RepID=A0A1E1MK14_RHYSE|nr:probable TIM21 Constituent of the mitochondrial inner membrane presequence translocase (TIM23 complex) [Rhynchosporium secalis]
MISIHHPALLRVLVTLRPIVAARLYATQTSLGATTSGSPRRKTVTPFNDDGRVAWGDLSKGEKAARATQQTFNFSFILIGAVMTAGVGYVMWTEVFSFDSKTTHFNKAVNRVKKDPRCTDLLGDGKKITAYGEPTWSKWARARPIASSTRKDQYGREHMIMHFNVEGPLNKGVVSLHMVKPPAESEGGGEYVYKYLTLDVRGHQKIYLENADATLDSPAKNKSKIFGISWR